LAENETPPPDEPEPAAEETPPVDPAPEPPPEEPEPAAEATPPEEPAPEPPPEQPAPEPPPQPSQPSLDDVVQQIHAIPIGPFLLSTVSTLASMAYGKLGAGQLDEARGAIDAIRALMPVLEGRIEPQLKRDFDQALANLQVAYADASAKDAS
jgi:hypothetical protein